IVREDDVAGPQVRHGIDRRFEIAVDQEAERRDTGIGEDIAFEIQESDREVCSFLDKARTRGMLDRVVELIHHRDELSLHDFNRDRIKLHFLLSTPGRHGTVTGPSWPGLSRPSCACEYVWSEECKSPSGRPNGL